MKLILLNRLEDESGISGTGIVAEGIEFDNGKCVISWLTEHTSITVYDSIEEVKAIHGHGGKTEILEYEFNHFLHGGILLSIQKKDPSF